MARSGYTRNIVSAPMDIGKHRPKQQVQLYRHCHDSVHPRVSEASVICQWARFAGHPCTSNLNF